MLLMTVSLLNDDCYDYPGGKPVCSVEDQLGQTRQQDEPHHRHLDDNGETYDDKDIWREIVSLDFSPLPISNRSSWKVGGISFNRLWHDGWSWGLGLGRNAQEHLFSWFYMLFINVLKRAILRLDIRKSKGSMLWLIFSQEVVLAKHHWKHLVQDYVAKFLPEMQIRNFESATKAIERPINLWNCFNGCIKKNFPNKPKSYCFECWSLK